MHLTQAIKVSGAEYCIPVDDQLVHEDGLFYILANLLRLFNITYFFDLL
jgi:hypothetical protein